MSLSKQCAEMEQVNPSLQKILKIGIVRDDLILGVLFFFLISREYTFLAWTWTMSIVHEVYRLDNHTRCVLNTRFTNTSGRTVNHTMPVVILKTRKGLSREQKRRIVHEFTQTLINTTGITPELVTILIEEHELEDIGKAGKLRCD